MDEGRHALEHNLEDVHRVVRQLVAVWVGLAVEVKVDLLYLCFTSQLCEPGPD